MTSTNENFIHRLLFKLRVHEAAGDSFQTLFSQVMLYENSGFQAIAPWGNWC